MTQHLVFKIILINVRLNTDDDFFQEMTYSISGSFWTVSEHLNSLFLSW